MTRRRIAQLALTTATLFTVLLPAPEELMDPVLRRLDKLLDDEHWSIASLKCCAIADRKAPDADDVTRVTIRLIEPIPKPEE